MRGKLIAGIAVVLAAAVGAAAYLWYNRDEAKIRRSLTALAGQIAKERGETPAAGALKAAGLDKFLAEKVHFALKEPNIQQEFSDAELKTLLIRLHNHADEFAVTLEGPEISVSGTCAKAVCKLTFTGSGRGEKERYAERRRCTLALEKIDGKWKITRCALSAPLDAKSEEK